MSRYVTDTHSLLWHIVGSPRLSPTARTLFSEADAGVHQILIPSIVLIEAIYLAEKRRISPAALDQLFQLLDLSPANYRVVPLDLPIVKALRAVNRAKIPEMPDRIIVATAKHLGAEIITKDAAIAAAGLVPTVW